MRVVAKGILWTLAVVAVFCASCLLYLRTGDLSRHQNQVEALLSGAIGHVVQFGGAFQLEVGRTTVLSAEDVQLSNLSWHGNMQLLAIGRVRIAVDTWSLMKGPLLIEDLNLLDVEVLSAVNSDGRHNWSPEETAVSGDEPIAEATVIEIRSFSMQSLILSHGDMKLTASGEMQGTFMADLGARPALSLNIESVALQASVATQVAEQAGGDEADDDTAMFFSDEPLLDLDSIDLDFSALINELRFSNSVLSDVVVNTKLIDGNIIAAPISFRELDGRADIGIEMRHDESLYTANVVIELENLLVGSIWEEAADRRSLPALSGSLTLQGEGLSLHQIMASSTGQASFRLGPGRLQPLTGTGFFGDVVLHVLRTLNPLNRGEPYTSLECAVLNIESKNGAAEIGKLAVQTNKIMIAGDGEIGLGDESLDMTIRAKPREGFGISVGGVANSFVKLGGTLSSPKLQLDAAGGATTAGAAVVTGGLSLVARGLWDRVSAANDICDEVLASDEEPTPSDDTVQTDEQEPSQER